MNEAEDAKRIAKRVAADAFGRRVAAVSLGFSTSALTFVYSVIAGQPVRGLAAAGLFWDIAGALLLVFGLLLSDRMIEELSASRWNGSSTQRAYWRETRIDAAIAGAMLTFGFGLQLVAVALGG